MPEKMKRTSNPPLQKVYCENCRYWHAVRAWGVLSQIGNCYYRKYYSSFVSHKDFEYPFHGKEGEQNKDNDCKYYKRKWWKFWIE